MIKRLYVHNFRCLENFELRLGALSSVLLIGRNGTGKTTIGMALEVLQTIARGARRVSELVGPKDMAHGRTHAPIRFEIDLKLGSREYSYSVAFELPPGFRELRVADEKLTVDGAPIFSRELAQVRLAKTDQSGEAVFGIDWHLVALPIVQEQSSDDPLAIFKQWLANFLILRPIPALAEGASEQGTLQPETSVKNLGAWFTGMIATAPPSYTIMRRYLSDVMPDFQDITNPLHGKSGHSLVVSFLQDHQKLPLAIEDLSDGERCFIIFALTIAANSAYGPILCFWDEPDNYLALEEVGQSVVALRNAFRNTGQLIVTSHNPEVIRRFSDENTICCMRNGHFEPTRLKTIEELRADRKFEGDLIDALIRGDVM